MSFVSDVTIPDGTLLPVGQEFTKTWRVQNSGTCQWTTGFKLIFGWGEAMGGQTVTMPAVVATGQQIDLSVKLKVPNKSGNNLTGYWRLEDDKNQPFGKALTVVISIGTVSPTPTGSATATPTQTFTPGGSTPTFTNTPENTMTPSNTPVPSETPTGTPTPTP